MIPNASNAIAWLENNPQSLMGIRRGIEREALRINSDGSLAKTSHPKTLGSALTHKYITTDFAETLLEFITPVDKKGISYILEVLRDLHRYVIRHLGEERLWPMSMPCFIDDRHQQTIVLAQYGRSNVGRMKTLYRKGLKNRYSALMQIISGVHYNFSLPLSFWQSYVGISNEISGKEAISDGYLKLIRNYHRLGWIIPYLFGASQVISQSSLNDNTINLPFQKEPSGLIYLPYSTSLRLGDLGYINHSQKHLNITFNHLDEYISRLRQAMEQPSTEYQKIGLKRNGRYLQLNTNMLQTENELYIPIRPKRVTRENESTLDALIRRGIEYVEVRTLDINPFSLTGIEEEQARFLDLFLIWCTLADAPKINPEELLFIRINWNRVILEGLKPGLTLFIDCSRNQQTLNHIGKLLFSDLQRVAKILDRNNDNMCYQEVCNTLVVGLDRPDLTLPARFLKNLIKDGGVNKLGLSLANYYRQTLLEEPLKILSKIELDNECCQSLQRQHALEEADILSFDDFFLRKMSKKI